MYNNNYPNGNMNPQMNNQQYSAPNYGGTPNYGGAPNYSMPNYNVNVYGNQNVPPEYRPIKPWGYIGYMLLYGLPLIGIIMLIVNACSTDNYNKRNFARSYLWLMLVSFIISILIIILAAVFGAIAANAR